MAKTTKKEVLYPIGIVAKMFGISVATMRLYEDEGLILPQKSTGNHRYYTERDLNRIACIRKMIEEKGLNLAGIRMVFSAIPCWEIKGCSQKDRNICVAYMQSDDPCWIAKNKNSVCASEDCSQCSVYNDLVDCCNIKNILRKYWDTGIST
jgi:MerR family transcriptional regulator/heat shock protein HspR